MIKRQCDCEFHKASSAFSTRTGGLRFDLFCEPTTRHLVIFKSQLFHSSVTHLSYGLATDNPRFCIIVGYLWSSWLVPSHKEMLSMAVTGWPIFSWTMSGVQVMWNSQALFQTQFRIKRWRRRCVSQSNCTRFTSLTKFLKGTHILKYLNWTR